MTTPPERPQQLNRRVAIRCVQAINQEIVRLVEIAKIPDNVQLSEMVMQRFAGRFDRQDIRRWLNHKKPVIDQIKRVSDSCDQADDDTLRQTIIEGRHVLGILVSWRALLGHEIT